LCRIDDRFKNPEDSSCGPQVAKIRELGARKGTISINGVATYEFILTAYDGDLMPTKGPDKFRIKITGAVWCRTTSRDPRMTSKAIHKSSAAGAS
jgi:hypothetical protein